MLVFIYLVLLCFVLYHWKNIHPAGMTPVGVLLLFFIKLLAGLAFWAIYTYYYTDRSTSDAFRYFDDARSAYELLKEQPLHYLKVVSGLFDNEEQFFPYYNSMLNWFKSEDLNMYNDNRSVIRMNLLLMPFSNGNYHVHTLVFNFVSTLGLLLLSKAFGYWVKLKESQIASIIFFIPSLLFWGSGVLKESLTLFSFGLFFYAFSSLYHLNKKPYVLWLFFGGLLLLSMAKLYVLIALIPTLIALLIIRKTKTSQPFLVFLFVHGLLFVLAINWKYIDKEHDVLHMLSTKQQEFITQAIQMKASSYIETTPVNESPLQLLINLPTALLNVLLRPFLWEAKNIVSVAAAFENLFLIIFLFIILLKRKKEPVILSVFPLSVLFFSLTLAALIGWVVPILGAIVRYKIFFLPFLFVLLFEESDLLKNLMARFNTLILPFSKYFYKTNT